MQDLCERKPLDFTRMSQKSSFKTIIFFMFSTFQFICGFTAETCLGVAFCVKGNVRLIQDNPILLRVSSRLECLHRCSLDGCCLAINFDQTNRTCEILTETTGETVPDEHSMLISTECGSWTAIDSNCLEQYETRGYLGFRRYDGYEIDGYDDVIIENKTLEECHNLCVQEASFVCRSINLFNGKCFLSRHTKDEVGDTFHLMGDDHLYHERTCFM